ncbi:MAG: InlB B-repeat-containing protein [Treponema sp.]|jgi:uncharacterized repeat protein (TIGR02543 family)|nr:InlB B-repeat-containing protein [Treponema sp.]
MKKNVFFAGMISVALACGIAMIGCDAGDDDPPSAPTKYTVTFNADGGSVTPSSIQVVSGGTAGILPAPTKTGYDFGGWYTAQHGGGTPFTAATPVTAALTVYAKWTAPVPQVTGVTVSPGSATVSRGQTRTFTAAVQGTGDPAQTVTWSVEGGGSGTSITSGGTLTVGAAETAASLTVRAVSTYDPTKSGTATVTVPQVTGVTVSPGSATVSRRQTQTFTATVQGTGSPAQTVTWSVEGGGSGTSITSGGILTVGAAETAASLTVRAVSTYDPTTSGTATVTVPAPGRGTVTLIDPEDAASGAFSDDTITLSKSGAGGKPAEHTLTVNGEYGSYQWRVDGTVKANSESIVLKAADYGTGTHQISVEVRLNGVPYAKSGSFTVEQ